MKLEKENNQSIIDLNLDLNETFREFGLGEPIIDTSLSLEETMERFLKQNKKDLSGRNWHCTVPK